MSAPVKVFGRLHDDPIRTRRRQAYEKHQWTKSREAARLWCGELYEGTPTLVVRDGRSREEVIACTVILWSFHRTVGTGLVPVRMPS